MLGKIPAEILHRILWDFLLRPETTQGLLPQRYHLQEDRRVCVYTLSDFQNARLVCRLWNQWLLNDFDFWRHLSITSAKNSLIAKDAISRFPEHPFEIRVLLEQDPYAESGFWSTAGRVYGSDGASDVEMISDSSDSSDSDLSAVDEADASDEGNGSVAGDLPQENNAKLDPHVLPSPEDASDLDADSVGDEGGSENSYEVHHSWVLEALDLVTPIIPHCHGLFLHLPTQMIHTALEKWANPGAPALSHCTLEAIDYDGRTCDDVHRCRSAADRRKLKPPPPPLQPFLTKSSDLQSILIMNYYVPTRSHQELGFDLTRLREFTMVYDRRDGPLIGPMEEDVLHSLVLPALEHKCQSIALHLAIDEFIFDVYHLHLKPSLENLTLCRAHVRISYLVPEDHYQTECHIRRFTMSDGQLFMGRHRGITQLADVLHHIVEEMPKLESLSLIRVSILCPMGDTDEPGANMGPYIPPSIPLPQFTTLFIQDSLVLPRSIIAFVNRTPNLEHLTLTATRQFNIKPIFDALQTQYRGSPTVPCPQLKWLRILHSRDELRNFPMPYLVEVDNLKRKRAAWLAKGQCVPFQVERISLEDFGEKYYACSVV
ncbi:hypothetical protein SISSUDRAFT_1048289 [Sistotremastrum suecicum HHB10207 ss-3]|uniref:F-box domain-containing protein n=1 Tax=Sistotremastrum suecicum HHB10207 ss-3 TaxID=1314776 RepID=A0A166CKH8_9AGAM|nr:hypothetical protein SISSUDRAFT_1048289 [Sistotremastrum suecicum HHB10207 ss-3]